APAGVSDRAFRFARLAEVLQNGGRLDLFFYPRERIPPHFTRMRAAASLVDPDLDLVVGDTGPAALWGAALAGGSSPCLAINFGNGHTLMALVEGNRFDGLFEHHTASLSPERMEAYIRRFAAGEDLGDEVFAEGGHGALPVSTPFSLTGTPIVVTGPRRQSFGTMKLPLREVSLHGDMMLTGCYGLLAGYRARRSGVQ
ncbi:MAG: pyruvate formate lyase-activating protein, partial [Thermoleophilia bacterium]|nr:pyruvate formate lyase-activating protein [Thermoleophilia bacterium]